MDKIRLAVLPVLLVYALASCARSEALPVWPEWVHFKSTFVSDGGRVIDRSQADLRSTSESQAYGMFFALVAGDRPGFASILNWTEENLADGDLTAHLPAWHWGRDAQDMWRVLDDNSASDADLWIAYCLLEAGRLWEIPRYVALGELVAQRLLQQSTVNIAPYGRVLIPAPRGFSQDEGTAWRINPSYWPLPLFDLLAQHDEKWRDVLDASAAMLLASLESGWPPDWIVMPGRREIEPGAYEAIRVYLWWGIMSESYPNHLEFMTSLSPMVAALRQHGVPPQTFGSSQFVAGPSSFSMALLPFLAALGETELFAVQEKRVQARPLSKSDYYGHALSLFSSGFMAGRYRLNNSGQLCTQWTTACAIH